MSKTGDSKKAIAKQFREETGGNGISTLFKLIDLIIADCHESNESNGVDEFRTTQGEIKGLRKLQSKLMKG